MIITKELLYAIAPGAKPEIVREIVNNQSMLADYGISDGAAIAFFLGQAAKETSGFTQLEENLYYTTAKRLRQVWPKRFKTDADAEPYLRNPQKLANFTYGGRLGNSGPDDGWLYRGSGVFQTTGRNNFAAVQKATGLKVLVHPELLRDFPEALQAAAIYWSENKLGRFVGDVAGMTKAIQGGAEGLADRKTYTERALKFMATGSSGTSGQAQAAGDMLRVGSRGPEVFALQRRLHDLGYVSVGNTDGVYGNATADAVKLFQQRYGLMADGVVGPATQRALNSARPSDHQDPEPLKKPTGLDNFINWLRGLFRRS